ncbi:Glucose-1-phosphate cytidylyltransferase [uncultured spirochete]|jgi:glucose-1-phosphate cytidylyltransferase|uniref:Glucose-1-phosphate cytidylyltransferase n=1 Tax=uncultured spirochete TaxID=156406 RepID=A0A3P3XGX8_9SPIR|nr:Glucose-1-phosphate cytidylyltransferase [uncultured spirochete]
MKVVILAGGYGTRISEESDLKPKPMIEIGGKPILWHIMKIYSHYGFNDFIICCGYKGYVIKDYFHNYYLHQTDITIDLGKNQIEYHDSSSEPWRVTLVDTGLNTMTGGRIKRIQPFVGDEPFMLTYGDGVSDIDILALLNFHKQHKRLATLTAVQPSGKFGALGIDSQNAVIQFQEKPKGDGAWINGGFFVCEPGIFDYIRSGDETIWERQPLEDLSRDGQLSAYKHENFWQPMDTLRDKNELERLWATSNAPWKVWE